MMSSITKDTYKLVFLGSSWVACIFTFFVPYNTINGPYSTQNLLIIPESNSKYCNTFRVKFNEQCSGGDSDGSICEDIRQDISDCLLTVKSAYEEINYKCLERKAIYQTCTMTYCEGGDGDDTSHSQDTSKKQDSNSKDESSNACQNKCAIKKYDLLDCEERIVQKWLKKEGIDDWHVT
jgi:hypothetical protein